MDIIINVTKDELNALNVSGSKLSSWIWSMISGGDGPLTSRIESLDANVLAKANVQVDVNVVPKVSG